MEIFLNICEEKLNLCLKSNKLPDIDLIEAIAVAKVKAVEDSIEMSFRLKQEVGSYALMEGSGFEQMDFLQCCKFAEGVKSFNFINVLKLMQICRGGKLI